MFPRILTISKNSSFFLFGPRGTGKTTLLKKLLEPKKTYWIDLLDYDLETQFLTNPKYFAELLASLPKQISWVVIDEVQKVPFLLEEVHRQVEKNPNRRFALTGSSARKLKRGKANLLAGRAFSYSLNPLTASELGESFSLNEVLHFGSLPRVFALSDPQDKELFLRAYAQTYLKEEVQAEGWVRNLPSFRRFLPLVARNNGDILSWSNFASDVGVDAKTIKSYFEILEETLIGFFLPAYRRSFRKKQRTHPKFYLFDTGVTRALAGILNNQLINGTTEYGRAFEHWVLLEIYRANEYFRKDYELSYFGTPDMEIDLVLETPKGGGFLVEIKSSKRVRDGDLSNLKALVKDFPKYKGVLICQEPRKRQSGSVLVCPRREALEVLDLAG